MRIARSLVCITLLLAPFATAATAATPPKPVLLPKAALHGDVFADPRAEKLDESSETGTTQAQDLVAHESADGCLQTGVYQTGHNRFTVKDPYPHDEFMYFLQGGVSLRSSDGSVTEVAAGDGVLLPKGWTGVWDSPGYRKIYVIYGCKTKD
jgi:uncharacterized cupin superfamily protein